MSLRDLQIWSVIVGLGACLVILLQNTTVVSVQLLFWQVSMSKIILFLLGILLGLAAGYYLGKKYR